jgi:hypothetical protein
MVYHDVFFLWAYREEPAAAFHILKPILSASSYSAIRGEHF